MPRIRADFSFFFFFTIEHIQNIPIPKNKIAIDPSFKTPPIPVSGRTSCAIIKRNSIIKKNASNNSFFLFIFYQFLSNDQ